MRIAIIIAAALLLSACRTSPPDAPELREVGPAERDSVITLLERVGYGTIDDAFARLAQKPHTLREHLHQLDADGRVNAYRRRTVDVANGRSETVFQEAEGTFDFGAFGRFVSFDDLDRLPQNPVPYLVPDEPPYLTPQGREAFHFAFGLDSTLSGRTLTVVEVTARPDQGDDQPVRRAVLLIDRSQNEVVGMKVRRESFNLLFGESSVFELQLRPFPGGGWLPETADYRVAVRAALTATRRFHLRREYQVDSSPQVARKSYDSGRSSPANEG